MKKLEGRKKTGLSVGELLVGGVLGINFIFGFAWPFFKLMTYAGKKRVTAVQDQQSKKQKDTSTKKWFELRHTKVNHPRYRFEDEYEATKAWCEAQNMQDMYIESLDGLKLHASYFPAHNAERIVVMVHGYRGTSFGSIAHIAKLLHDNRCDLLFVDQRCCGNSEGKYITFGAKEQLDVYEWVHYINDLNGNSEDGKKLPIYLYGQSMGATTVLLATGHRLPEEVKGVIADAGYHNMKQQLSDIASGWFHLRWIDFLLYRVDIYCRVFAGFSMKETDVTNALKKNKLPVLFFHGVDDTYVWPSNSVHNYEICTAKKKLILIPHARHLCCSYVDPKKYNKAVLTFFEKTK